MRMSAKPVRFLAGVVALWIGGRIWWLLPPEVRDASLRPEAGEAAVQPAPARPVIAPASSGEKAASVPIMTAGGAEMAFPPASPATAAPVLATRGALALPIPAPAPSASPPPRPSGDPPALSEPMRTTDDAPLPLAGPTGLSPRASRWSGSAYLFARNGGSGALAAGGQLGGGQAGARIAWRVNRDGPPRVALAARVYVPIDDGKGAEGAAGVDFHPLPGRPLRLSVERRFDLGGDGRDAWSVYAAGGFWREVGRGVELDGYAQAGIVGLHARDRFGDGALRLAARRDLGDGRALRLGGGAWAGAQPGVARLDLGPRVALGLPLGPAHVTAAIEGRFRVAGDAAPGSGVALTLAGDF